MKKLILIAGTVCFCASPALASSTVNFTDNQGKDVGTAVLSESDDGVKIDLDLHGLPPGEHAMHVHETGLCSPSGTFKDAGGHLNPFGRQHGKLSENAEHAGDMDNIIVAPDGTVKTSVVNKNITLGTATKDKAALLDNDGAAFIIHVGKDDYKTQPTGNAGDRLACALITK